MKNPRFKKESIYPLRTPDRNNIQCKDCEYAEKDIKFKGKTMYGAESGRCEAYEIKPPSVILGGEECEYYLEKE